MADWWIFQGSNQPHDGIGRLPEPPPWRRFRGDPVVSVNREYSHAGRAGTPVAYQADPVAVEFINTALYLRRPLLITGEPGSGKSSLADAVAYELRLGPVLRWPITSKSDLADGLYRYDAVGRIEEASVSGGAPPDEDLGRFVRLGPLGTALLPYDVPRVLLIDEIDKSDYDLPNDLLNVFEEGQFEIPELARSATTPRTVSVATADSDDRVPVTGGRVICRAFPLVIMTSNREREFPAAFLRRCIRLQLDPPDPQRLAAIVTAHLGAAATARGEALIEEFLSRREVGALATDQLLNAVYLSGYSESSERERLAETVLQSLDTWAK